MTYPLLGMAGSFVRHAPIGLLYAASRLVKRGVPVEVFDLRLHAGDWKEKLKARLTPETLAVGVSVMTGKPILSALEIGAFVKSVDPGIKVVWGGPFATFHPELILAHDPNCDFVVSGYGSAPFDELVRALEQGIAPAGIPGVFFRDGNRIAGTPADWSRHEFLDFRDIPYHLIPDYGAYGQLDQQRTIFSLYSAMGCAYKCAFCSSPALYGKIQGRRWAPYAVEEVAEHIRYVVDTYGADYIYFIDDDSFVSLEHVDAVIKAIGARGLPVKLGFRGARINEIKRMDHAFLDRLTRAGTDILHIGAESGSDRILKLVRKDCTVADILECNRKLAEHPEIFLFYNFIVGLPTETLQDLKGTARLMHALIEGHPRCIIGTPNQFRPLPGTELFQLARQEWGYVPPADLKGFTEIEVEGNFELPWFSKEFKRFCDMLLMTSYFVDDKINKLSTGKTAFYRLMRAVAVLYSPVARFRLRHAFAGLLAERVAYNVLSRLMAGSQQAGRPSGEG